MKNPGIKNEEDVSGRSGTRYETTKHSGLIT